MKMRRIPTGQTGCERDTVKRLEIAGAEQADGKHVPHYGTIRTRINGRRVVALLAAVAFWSQGDAFR